MNTYHNSFRTWLLPILFCSLCGNLAAQQWLTVRDGNTSSPYYTFKTPEHAPIDISTYDFQRGQSYAFLPQGLSTTNPFMIGEHNGDMNSSLISVVGGGTPTPLVNNTSNLMVTIPSNYSGDLVYFSTTNTSFQYHLKIVNPPGGNYQSAGGSYQPVYDLNASHLTNLSVHINQSFAGKYSFFNRTNSSGSPEIRLELMEVANGQWQPRAISSSLYYVAKPDLFPTVPDIYDYLTSINLGPVNGYKPPGVAYQSSGGGNQSGGSANNTPQYETQPTLMVDQSNFNTGIPYPETGVTWYQSFTADSPSKLQKFAFVTNGAFTASATVKIREGEGIAGNILHTGTWTGIGNNTNNYNEYVIDNDVVLIQGQKYTIQLENQTAGGFLGYDTNQYNGGKFHYSGYGDYGDLKMKIWVLMQTQPAGGTIAITAPSNGSNAEPNTDLTVAVQYASGSGGYQTPTWAYRIDSGFPAYGSPHGGTQITGVTTANDFLNGQPNGMRQVNVALLDQAGNLHNPPIVQTLSVNYQSGGGGYQTGGGGYQSPGNGYQTPGNGYQSPGNGYQTPGNGYQTPGNGYQSPGNGQKPLELVNQISQVRTVSHQLIPSAILITGELLDQNASAIHMIEVGFFVSPSMQLSLNDSLTQKVSAVRKGSGIFSTNIATGNHQVLYFRAYAQTPQQTTLGNIRKISIEGKLNQENQRPQQEALSILAADSVEEDGGWIRNPWFGRYKDFNNGWIYHFVHGWLYLASDNFNGVWAWSESRGWVWSKKGVYPFLYQSNMGNWIYLLTNEKGEVRYYNYSTNLLEDVLP
jgi:hypothetical protein